MVPSRAIALPIRMVTRKPCRMYRRPAVEAARGQPRVSAATAAPETSGGALRAFSRYVGTKLVTPIISAPTPRDTSVVVRISGRARMVRSTIGSAARRSTNTNQVSAPKPTAKLAMPGTDSHAHAFPPSRRARMTAVSPTVSSVAPA